MSETTISLEGEMPPSDQDAVWRGLTEFAEAVAGPKNRQPLFVAARDAGGALVGGLIGASAWSWLMIDGLWVHERHRRGGIGTGLIALAEAEGRRRGCVGAMLETFSFEARPFYEKLGYRVHSSVENHPPGHQRLGMCKVLSAPER